MEIPFAKSENRNGYQEPLDHHSRRAAELAEEYGRACGMSKEAYIAALYHDCGKASMLFQMLLKGKVRGVDHAFGSAMALSVVASCLGEEEAFGPLIDAVNAHHEGVALPSELQMQFRGNLENDKDTFPVSIGGRHRNSVYPKREDMLFGLKWFLKTVPEAVPTELPKLEVREELERDRVWRMLFTRMLLSCVVDADYTASAEADGIDVGPRENRIDADACLKRLTSFRNRVKKATAKNGVSSVVANVREELYKDCTAAGKGVEALCTATAPTGAGKTLSLMSFALQRCKSNKEREGKRRIIVVLPYLSLADQTEEIYKQIIPDTIVDHSNSKLSDEQRLLAARWDAPCIITTSVKFFESLFSANPRDCRKLHNIADSVVIFDEAQTLPAKLAKCTTDSLRMLAETYNTTVILSTATQPAFEAIEGAVWKPNEVVRNAQSMFDLMKRCEVDWDVRNPEDKKNFSEKRTAFADIAEEMAKNRRICTIVNLKRHANTLYELLRAKADDKESVFIITASLCQKHRRKVLAAIRKRMDDGLPVRVVATQCIEAGVDLDFDIVYRALAPLDSIIQAAGRCNRNGRLPMGKVVVFIPEDEEGKSYYPENDNTYHDGIMTVKQMLSERGEISISSFEDINTYYQMYFERQEGLPVLEEAIEGLQYQEVEKEYKLIKSDGVRVIVPYIDTDTGDVDSTYARIITEIKERGAIHSAGILKDITGISVTCYDRLEYIQKHCSPVIVCNRKILKDGHELSTGTYIVNEDSMEKYRSDVGLITFKDKEE